MVQNNEMNESLKDSNNDFNNSCNNIHDKHHIIKKEKDFKEKSKLLKKNLTREHLRSRTAFGNNQVLYIEGWQAIEIANNIFGYDGWSSKNYDMKEEYREVKEERGYKVYSLSYTCMCRITLNNGVYHEDIGFGSTDGMRNLGKAIEKAKKGAVTDALKRTLRLFGNALGNCCYNKEFITLITKPKNEKKYVTKEKKLSLDYFSDRESSIDSELFVTDE